MDSFEMEEKMLYGTDRKSQLFFPKDFRSSNFKEHLGSCSYDSHNFLDFLESPMLPDSSGLACTDVSEYFSREDFNEEKNPSFGISSPHISEQFQKFEENSSNSINAPKEFSLPLENLNQYYPDEFENRESLIHPRKEGVKQSSLFDLTIRFFDILLHSPSGSVDLNVASRKLDVRKRRLYDVLNVCEGVGVLDKTTKNCVKLKENGVEAISNMQKFWWLQQELRMIEEEESEIERELFTYNDMANSLRCDHFSCTLSMLCSDSTQKKLLIEAPAGSTLKVLKPKLSTDRLEWLYQIAVKSSGGKLAYRILSGIEEAPRKCHSSSKQTRKRFNLTKYWPCETVSMFTK